MNIVILQNLLNSSYFRETVSFKKIENRQINGDEYITLIPSSKFITLTDLYSNWKSEFMHKTTYIAGNTDEVEESDLKIHLKRLALEKILLNFIKRMIILELELYYQVTEELVP